MVNTVLLVLFGWLLGLLGSIVVDENRRRRRLTQIRDALVMELSEIRLKLAFTAYIMAMHFGTWDRDFLKWTKTVLDSYGGINADPEIHSAIAKLLAMDDQQLNLARKHSKAAPLGAVGVKTYVTPFIDSNLDNVTLFSRDFQQVVLETKAQLRLINEQVELAQFYYQQTFASGITPENFQIVTKNLRDTYQRIGGQARTIANLVERCVVKAS